MASDPALGGGHGITGESAASFVASAPMGVGLSRPSRAAVSGGAHHGTRTGTPLWLDGYAAHECSTLCLPPGVTTVQAHTETVADPSDRARVYTLCGAGDVLPGRGISRARPGRGGHHPDASGSNRLAGHRVNGRHCHFILPQLVEAYGQVGQVAEALHLIAEALAMLDTTGEYSHEAQLHLLHGEFLLRQAVPDPRPKPAFSKPSPLLAASRLSACELRAAMSFARLWQCQGKRCRSL